MTPAVRLSVVGGSQISVDVSTVSTKTTGPFLCSSTASHISSYCVGGFTCGGRYRRMGSSSSDLTSSKSGSGSFPGQRLDPLHVVFP